MNLCGKVVSEDKPAMAAAVKVLKAKKAAEAVRRADGKIISPKIVAAFKKYDVDGGGTIDTEELSDALKDLGMPVSNQNAVSIVAVYSGGKSDVLDMDAFDRLCEGMRKFRALEPFVRHSVLGRNKPLPYQSEVRLFYTHPAVVWSVASIIIGNFVVNILEKELDPDLSNPCCTQTWETFDLAFNIVFLFELLVNMYGYGGPVRAFWRNGWNVFDFFIVVVGVVLMTGIDLGELSKLKLLRAFRVFRLFKRVKSLNKIIVALIMAIPGVFNAFVILFIFFCIYAILAVELFREFGDNGTYIVKDLDGVTHYADSITTRGYTNGIEYYGTYTRAMFTLFQVMTGESWSEAVARPLLFGLYQDSTLTVGLFYVSFVILTQMVLINVVVAVLLDNFVTDGNKSEDGPEEMSDEDAKLFLEDVMASIKTPASSGRSSPSSKLFTANDTDAAANADAEPPALQDKVSSSPTLLALPSPLPELPPAPTADADMSTRMKAVEASMRVLNDKHDLLHEKLDMLLSTIASQRDRAISA